MKSMTRLVAIVLALLSAASIASAQGGFKAGYVNTETVIEQMPEAIDARKKMDDVVTKWRDTLQIMQKEFETRVANYQKQQSLMSADAKTKEEESLNRFRMTVLQFNDEKFGQTGEVAKMRQVLMVPIQEKVKEAINQVVKEEKLNVVLDKTGGIVLYSDDKADITFKVLDKLKRGAPGK